jgi:endonuclease YncB( thermonuclease family)
MAQGMAMRRSIVLKTAVAGLVAFVALSGAEKGRAESLVLQGQARVEDNATLEIWGQRIRLQDIVVPDPASAEGREGKRYLEGLITAVTVRCVVPAPIYRAAVPGHCFAGSVDIGESLVVAGHARQREQTSRH